MLIIFCEKKKWIFKNFFLDIYRSQTDYTDGAYAKLLTNINKLFSEDFLGCLRGIPSKKLIDQ